MRINLKCIAGVAVCLAALAAIAGPVTRAAERDPGIRFEPPVLAISHCVQSCYEPTVAVDPRGRVFVTAARDDPIAVSQDGGAHYRQVPPPATPTGGVVRGDSIVQIDPQGRLVYSTLVATGIQIAVSSDAGRSWDWNTFVGVPGATAPLADRQWIGFGPNRAVYVLWRTEGFVYWSAASMDGGRTFGPPSPFLPGNVIGAIGPPVVDPSGRVYVPALLLGATDQIAVAVSASGVGTTSFVVHPVESGESGANSPKAAVDTAGHVSVAYSLEPLGGREPFGVRVARSIDRGQTWSKPLVVSRSALDSSSIPPWLALRPGGEDVLWYDKSGRLTLSRTSHSSKVEMAVVAEFTGRSTDFAHFAVLPDGRVVAAWISYGVVTSVESK